MRRLWRSGWDPVLLAALLLLLAWGVGYHLWGERLPRNKGFGWDGTLYCYMTRFPCQQCYWGSPYSGMRFLLPFTAHVVLRGLGFPLDGPHILHAFAGLNLVMFLATLLALWGCCRELNLGPAARGLLYAGFFVNYAHLKHYHYAVCQTDVWATCLSTFLVLAYLRRSTAGMLLATVAGAFVWPALPHVGALLFLFPRRGEPGAAAPDPRPAPARLHLVIGALAAATAILTIAWRVGLRGDYGWQPGQVLKRWLPVSTMLTAAYLFGALTPLSNERGLFAWPFRGRLFWQRVILLGVAFGVVELVRSWITPLFPRPNPYQSPLTYLQAQLIFSVSKPLIFLVAHAAWFGPLVVLAGLWWRDVCREAHRLGLGIVLTLALGLLMGLGAETRQCVTAFPVLAILTAVVADRRGWGAGRVLAFAGLALVVSRIWVPLNPAPWPDRDALYSYPMQRLFMCCGWMTTRSYCILGAAGLATLGLTAALALLPARRAGSAAALAGGCRPALEAA